MKALFESFIKKYELFKKTDKLLIALSGGVDSVVLCQLLKEGAFKFDLAHCNFQLRGKDSEKDEEFCVELSQKLNVRLHTTRFETELFSKKNGISIQMAARDLRYAWFQKLMVKENYDFLLTAHHAGDNTETVLINLMRGTGIKGLKGIQLKNQRIARPLLCFTKDEIESFAKKNKLKFRKDKSNDDDKYERNYLRLKVIPKLKKLRPDLDILFTENSERFSEEAEIVNEYVKAKLKKIVSEKAGIFYIDRAILEKEKFKGTLIHHLFSPFGFNETQRENLMKNLWDKSISGKKYLSKTHEVHLERNEIVISPTQSESESVFEIYELNELEKHFNATGVKTVKQVKPSEILIEKSKLIFPLQIRSAVTGDKFRPFGMKGFKLISDFYKDKKFSALQKKQTKLLVNGNGEIIWVIGYRSDDRYKVGSNPKDILKLELIEGR